MDLTNFLIKVMQTIHYCFIKKNIVDFVPVISYLLILKHYYFKVLCLML